MQNFAAQAVIAIENVRLLETEQQRTRELTESLEQQTATSEVLQVISKSQTAVQPVLHAVVESAARLCQALSASIYLRDGDVVVPYAHSGPLGRQPIGKRLPLNPDWVTGRAVLEARSIHVPDLRTSDEYPQGKRDALKYGHRATLAVPFLREGAAIGNILVRRREARPFTDKQIELVQNFAAQAVIAIENTRLLNELRQSLEQQTATADVLRVISSSPGELEPVFQVMLDNATRICDAKFGTLFRIEGNAFHLAAQFGTPPELAEYQRQRGPFIPGPGSQFDSVMRTKQVSHTADMAAEAIPARLGGARSFIGVPMLKDDVLIGAIGIYRQEVRPFTDKQIELVSNFAAQAVIAIENTRLLNELRQSLEQQTATAEVLSVISSSPGDLEPVFQTMLENAVRICGAKFGNLLLMEQDFFLIGATHGAPAAYVDYLQREGPFRVDPRLGLRQLLSAKRPYQVADITLAPTYGDKLRVATMELAHARTVMGVPMIKDGEVIGSIVIYRQEVQPFTEKQIDVVKNFAAQAVIAIENTRLLSELRESLQQQMATADVLKVISRSTFDLQTVLQTLVESAAHLCDADKATITRQKEGVFYRAESYGFSAEFMEYVRSVPVEAERGTATGRALLEGKVIHIADVRADSEYTFAEAQRLGDFRTIIGVPMLREGRPVGVLTLTRSKIRPFTEKQIELVSTFADQAAIAIENVRLFESVEARTRELTKSLEDLHTAQDRLVQTEKLASLGQLTAGIAHEIKNPLNFVNNFSSVSVELIDELREALSGAQLNDKLRTEIGEIADMLQGNLVKVVQHGKRADAIVKNMLLHSRQGSEEHRPVDINTLVEESLNLAYHGARAEKQDFNVTLERSFDPTAGEADLFPQDITRVLLNLISNSFYATNKRKGDAAVAGYEPTVTASTKDLGHSVEIKIRDNGIGVRPEVKEKMFNPFFTTKPPGEGTGLGLSLSHDIIVKQHGGSIEVDTQPGAFTEFRIVLPRTGASLIKSGEPASH